MRVISGTAKGRKLKTPDGFETRPTTDRVKESVFNIIQFDISGACVLDLFAGSGQLGIEALSRGADRAVFIDTREECIKIIRDNLQITGFTGKAQVYKADFKSFIKDGLRESFDLVFLDPPYKGLVMNEALQISAKFDILKPHGIIICESASEYIQADIAAPYGIVREYRYGGTKITLIMKTGG